MPRCPACMFRKCRHGCISTHCTCKETSAQQQQECTWRHVWGRSSALGCGSCLAQTTSALHSGHVECTQGLERHVEAGRRTRVRGMKDSERVQFRLPLHCRTVRADVTGHHAENVETDLRRQSSSKEPVAAAAAICCVVSCLVASCL